MHVEDFIPAPSQSYRDRLDTIMAPWKVPYGVLSAVVMAILVGGIAAMNDATLAIFYLFSLGWLPAVPVAIAMVAALFVQPHLGDEGDDGHNMTPHSVTARGL